jgi:hypothetical protein
VFFQVQPDLNRYGFPGSFADFHGIQGLFLYLKLYFAVGGSGYSPGYKVPILNLSFLQAHYSFAVRLKLAPV